MFGIHKNLEVNLEPGINIIKGENRTGKTWILESPCFAYFGKTKSCKISKIVNYDAEKASVEIIDDDMTVKRSRSRDLAKLEKPTKTILEDKLNLSYQEFLRLFYISAQESFALFEPAYFRTFLIKLFDLEKYSKIYKKLQMQKQGLEAQVAEGKKVNTKLYEKRAQRVIGIQKHWKDILIKMDAALDKYDKALKELNNSKWKATSGVSQLKSRAGLIAKDKCPTCERPFKQADSQKELAEIKKQYAEIQTKVDAITVKELEFNKGKTKLKSKQDKVRTKIYKCNSVYATIKERGKEIPATGNLKRIAELDHVLPFFNPNGFPAHLLQIYLPVIQETANSLLRRMFPDMELEIRATKPDSNKPDFKIFIIRYGEEVEELADCSGAETIIINLCLRLGIMVIFKQLNNTSIDFLMIDEGLDKLDEKNVLRIIDLLNKFMDMGYIKQVILVSHMPILKELEGVNYIEILPEGGTDES